MKLDLTKTFKDTKGITFNGADGKTPLTAKEACMLALDTPQQNMSGKEKYERFKLIKKIEENADFTTEELAKLKEVIGESLTLPSLVGQLWDWVETASSEKKLEAVK
jgi:hypothetical protein